MKKAALMALPVLLASHTAFAADYSGKYSLHDNWGTKYGKSFGVVDFAGNNSYYSVSAKTTSAILELFDNEASIHGKVLNIKTGKLEEFKVIARNLQSNRPSQISTKWVSGHLGGQRLDCSVKSAKGFCQFKLTKTSKDDYDIWIWAGNNHDLGKLDVDAKLTAKKQPTEVPAPSSMLLLASGVAAMFGFARFKRGVRRTA